MPAFGASRPLTFVPAKVRRPAGVDRATEVLNKALCDAGRCPTYTVFKDHGHLSQLYSVGTTDTSVSGPILEIVRKVE